METQIRETFRRAFFDLIGEKIDDHDWLVRLYAEVRDRVA